jgi:hypothetical protein
MFGVLISEIQLLSNNKSFQILIDTNRDLWILSHLKDLIISKSSILYQRQTFHKKTPYPIRKLKKKFLHTPELLTYLNYHSWRYNSKLRKFSLNFSNGWNVNISGFHIELEFNTNTLKERDHLINKLLTISGIDPIDCSKLTPNIDYIISLGGDHLKTYCNIPHPDRFWSQEKIIEYNIQSAKLESLE